VLSIACIEGGGSLRDIQQLAGHSNLATTQRYIEGSSDAKRRSEPGSAFGGSMPATS
jgi:hypothetical protein